MFVVRQSDNSEREFATVQEAFKVGGGREQQSNVTPRTVVYPIVLLKAAEGYYGPVLRP